MGRLGFEPRTNQLKAEYSTVELTTHIFFARMTFITCLARSMQQETENSFLSAHFLSQQKAQTSAMVEKIHFFTS
jgi:hypothetical protein